MRLGSLGIIRGTAARSNTSSLQYLMSRGGAKDLLLDGSPPSVIVTGPRRVLAPFSAPLTAAANAAVVATMPSDFLPSRYKRRAPITDAMLDETCDLRRLRQLKERGSSYDSTGIRRPHERLVFKNGECNITRANIKKRRQRYMADIFTTLVDIKWRWNLLNFVLAFMLSWLIFALVWWLICFSHGDFVHYVPPEAAGPKRNWKPCVEEVRRVVSLRISCIVVFVIIGRGWANNSCTNALFCLQYENSNSNCPKMLHVFKNRP